MTSHRASAIAAATVLFAVSAGCRADLALAQSAPTRGADAIFTVGRYPVEADAENSVAAKERALADGYQGAFQSLLRRVVPVTAYDKLKPLRSYKAADLIDGVAVRSERNSQTTYIATLDFSFSPKGVRDLLRQRGIPYIETQAPPVAVAAVYIAPAGGGASLAAAQGSKAWTDAWRGLDIEQTLTPVQLVAAPASGPGALSAATADPDAVRRAFPAVKGPALVAVLEPDLAARRLKLRVSGSDGVGPFVLTRSFRFEQADIGYGSELAAVIVLGILEGRWKAVRVAAVPGGEAALSAPLQPVQLMVEFRSMAEWQSISRRISDIPGVEDYDVAGLSTRGANVALRFPGGGAQLKRAMAFEGIDLESSGGAWIARMR